MTAEEFHARLKAILNDYLREVEAARDDVEEKLRLLASQAKVSKIDPDLIEAIALKETRRAAQRHEDLFL